MRMVRLFIFAAACCWCVLGVCQNAATWQIGAEFGTGLRNPYTTDLFDYSLSFVPEENHINYLNYYGGLAGVTYNDTLHYQLRIGQTIERFVSTTEEYASGSWYETETNKIQKHLHISFGALWKPLEVKRFAPIVGCEVMYTKFGDYTEKNTRFRSDSLTGVVTYHRISDWNVPGGNGISLALTIGFDLRIFNSVNLNLSYVPTYTAAWLGGEHIATTQYVVPADTTDVFTDDYSWNSTYFANQVLLKLIYSFKL